jgi:methylenetetrahydrofolate reductase (NADPH)
MSEVADHKKVKGAFGSLENDNVSLVAKRPSPRHVGSIIRIIPAGTQIYLSADADRPPYLASDGAQKLAASGFCPVPHVAVRMFPDLEALDQFLATLSGVGVDRLFVIAGDVDKPAGVLNSSLPLFESGLLQKHGIVETGIAGYPEGHPFLGRQVLERCLAEKIASAESGGLLAHIATQFCFSPERIAEWIQTVRERGFEYLIKIGMPGPSTVSTLLDYAGACGVVVSEAQLRRDMTEAEGDLWTPHRLLEELGERFNKRSPGQVSLNFFAFGGLSSCARWIAHTFVLERGPSKSSRGAL